MGEVTMDDKFLYRFRREPPTEFEKDLLNKLQRPTGLRLLWTEIRSSRQKTVLSAVIALAAIGLMAACAREVLLPRWIQVGEFEVFERSRDCPDSVIFERSSGADFTNPPPDPADLLTLDEIKSRLAYDLMVPTWAPQGFEPSFKYTDVVPTMSIHYFWYTPGGQTITMYASPVNPNFDELSAWVHTGTAEAVTINGNPGVLIRGGCGFVSPPQPLDSGVVERVWDDNFNELKWRDSGVTYDLITLGPAVSADDLVKMAESAR
jgi:hypothetical protein